MTAPVAPMPTGLVFALFGLMVGSFLNVCIYRLPRRESIVFPASHCTACGKAIQWYQNLPVISWLVLRGRCASCGDRISIIYPMVELLTYLRANGFKTFIVSGGGVEFMRGWTERVYGIPPEQVIGSAGKVKFEMRDGTPVLIKLPELDFIDDKEGKPAAIQSRIGRRPIAAFGNSDGDLQMLQWTMTGSGARFALFVHHDDAAREFAYDRADKLQTFDKGWDEATAKGWTVVSMKNDWKTIFPAANVTGAR